MHKIQLFCKPISAGSDKFCAELKPNWVWEEKAPPSPEKGPYGVAASNVRLYRRLLVLRIVYMMFIFELASLTARTAKFMSQVAFNGVLMQKADHSQQDQCTRKFRR
ncbi:uncharacterized protein IAS62_005014 [Cryptococcus decagattii]|uniref:Uncharacterized protein n=1 Tax=Cryptococcus decagattii TaxID=1859122 RepID=A0ABZ2AZN7_9TREE